MDLVDFISILSRSVFTWPRILLNKVWHPIPYLERRVLETAEDFILQDYLPIYREQISCINYAQRQFQRTVLFEWKFPGRFNWQRNQYFKPLKGQNKVVNYEIEFENGKKLHGNILADDGVICNVTHGEWPGYFKKTKIKIIRIRKGSIVDRKKVKAHMSSMP